MDTRHLKIFATVYKTRSFTKAAQTLFTSQPTISEHMRNLESKLGCKLFDRLGRSIMPTPEADLLFPKAIEILDEMNKIEETLASVANSVSGELLIGASTIPGAYILPAFAASFKNRYPDISFQINIRDSATIVKRVVNNELYLGVVGARINNGKVNYVRFGSDELVLAAEPSYDIEEEISPSKLYELDFLLREQGSGTRKSIEDILAKLEVNTNRLKIRATLGSSTAIKEAIKAGLGVSILSRVAIRDELEFGLLKEIKIKGMEMNRSFYIVMPKIRTMPNHYTVFAAALKNYSDTK